MAINPVAVQFTGDAKAFFAEMAKVRNDMGALTKEVSAVSRASASLQKNLTRGLAGFASFATLRSMIRETSAAQAGVAQLDAALRSTGEAAGWSRNQLLDMARDFARSTTFGQTDIVAAQTRLLSYSSIVGENVPRAMQAVVDQSARLGIGLSQSAEIIGRALEKPSQGMASLSQQGFRFTDDQKRIAKALEETGRIAEAQGIVFAAIEESYGGAAVAARDTFGGALASVQNAVRDLITGKDGSLDSAAEGINALSDALRSPEIQAGVSMIIAGLAKVIELASKAAAGIAILLGKGPDEQVNIDNQILRMQKAKEQLERSLYSSEVIVTSAHVKRIEAAMASIDKEIADLQRQWEEAGQRKLDAAGLREKKDPPPDAPYLPPAAQKDEQKGPSAEYLTLERDLQLRHMLNEQALAAGEELATAELELNLQTLQQRFDDTRAALDAQLAAEREAADERMHLEQEVQGYIANLQDANANRVVGLLSMIGQRNKGAAVAAIALEKWLTAKRIIQQNLVAAELAFASQLIPGQPWTLATATAAKASVLAQGHIAVGLVAAEGVLQAAGAVGGRGSGVVGPGTPNNPIFTQSGEDQQYGVSQQPSIQVHITGYIGAQQVDEMIDAIGQAVNGRDVVVIKPNSRQAQEIRETRYG